MLFPTIMRLALPVTLLIAGCHAHGHHHAECAKTCCQTSGCAPHDIACLCDKAASGSFLDDMASCLATSCPKVSLTNFADHMNLTSKCEKQGKPLPDGALSSAAASSYPTASAAPTGSDSGASSEASSGPGSYPTQPPTSSAAGHHHHHHHHSHNAAQMSSSCSSFPASSMSATPAPSAAASSGYPTGPSSSVAPVAKGGAKSNVQIPGLSVGLLAAVALGALLLH